MADKKVRVTQIRSAIGRNERQKATLTALGLGRIGKSRDHVLNGQVAGMIKKVEFLIRTEELS